MKPAGRLLLLTGLLGVAAYSGMVLYRQQELLTDSALTFRSLKVKFNNAITSTLSGILRFENKSAYSFKIISQHINIYLNNKMIGSIDNGTVIQVNAKSVTDIPMSAQFNLIDTVGTALQGVDNAELIIRGRIYVRHSIFFLTVPIDLTYRVSDILN